MLVPRNQHFEKWEPTLLTKLTFKFLILLEKMEPMTGIEPATYALRKRCSTN